MLLETTYKDSKLNSMDIEHMNYFTSITKAARGEGSLHNNLFYDLKCNLILSVFLMMMTVFSRLMNKKVYMVISSFDPSG